QPLRPAPAVHSLPRRRAATGHRADGAGPARRPRGRRVQADDRVRRPRAVGGARARAGLGRDVARPVRRRPSQRSRGRRPLVVASRHSGSPCRGGPAGGPARGTPPPLRLRNARAIGMSGAAGGASASLSLGGRAASLWTLLGVGLLFASAVFRLGLRGITTIAGGLGPVEWVL